MRGFRAENFVFATWMTENLTTTRICSVATEMLITISSGESVWKQNPIKIRATDETEIHPHSNSSGALFVRGQGTFVWDQGFTNITDQAAALTNTPLGQGVTPTTSSMDAAAFYLSIGFVGGVPGDAEVLVRSGSVTGAIIGTSNPETVSGGNGTVYDFTFSSPVALTPGTQYYLEPVELSGNLLNAQLGVVGFGKGQAIYGGVADHTDNFYFEEGIQVVPEPSIAALLMIGGGITYWHRRRPRVT